MGSPTDANGSWAPIRGNPEPQDWFDFSTKCADKRSNMSRTADKTWISPALADVWHGHVVAFFPGAAKRIMSIDPSSGMSSGYFVAKAVILA